MSERTLRGVLRGALLLLVGLPGLARLAAADVPVTGCVRDPGGRPIAGALVSVEGRSAGTLSGPDGRFLLEVPAGRCALAVSREGFAPLTLTRVVVSAVTIELTLVPLPHLTEAVVVQAIRADPRTPVTKTDLGGADLERLYHGQDMPALLTATPSVTQYSENGTGNGYSYFYLRGIQQTRINMTLDGVPLNDPEESALYFANFGGFAGALDSVQIQRGVGTSTVGAASFGGSINFESLDPAGRAGVEATLGAGSFGTGRGSLALQSPRFGSSLAFYGLASLETSDGFRDHSGVRQRSFFFGATRQDQRSVFKLFGFSGREWTHLSFLATEARILESALRYNAMAPEEKDHFGQDFIQAQYTRALGPTLTLLGQLYYQRQQGHYRLFADPDRSELDQYGLAGDWVGLRLGASQKRGPFGLILGAHANAFTRDHFLDVVGGGRGYFNTGTKTEASAFAKLHYDRSRVRLFADGQLRHARFRYEGDVPLGSVGWTFFNPKLGLRFDATRSLGFYASLGRTTREPTRPDLLAGEDNATFPYDLQGVKPEQLVDLEAGLEYHTSRLALAADVYAMGFRNEIALTGELSEIGLPRRRNVDRSYRRGLELEASIAPRPSLRVRMNAQASRSRIHEWTQFYDVYDVAGSYLGSEPRTLQDRAPLLSPGFVASLGMEWSRPWWLRAAATGRFVAGSYLDNTANREFRTPSFFDLGARLEVRLARAVHRLAPRLRVDATNLLDNRREFPSGYSYLFLQRDAGGERLAGTAYYYPLATRAVFVNVDFKL